MTFFNIKVDICLIHQIMQIHMIRTLKFTCAGTHADIVWLSVLFILFLCNLRYARPDLLDCIFIIRECECCKFISTESAYDSTVSKCIFQNICQRLQGEVTFFMSELIINYLQIIHIRINNDRPFTQIFRMHYLMLHRS